MRYVNKERQNDIVLDGHITDTLKISDDFIVTVNGDEATITSKVIPVVNDWLHSESLYRQVITVYSDYIQNDVIIDLSNEYQNSDLLTHTDLYCYDSNGNLLEHKLEVETNELYIKTNLQTGNNPICIYFGSTIENLGTLEYTTTYNYWVEDTSKLWSKLSFPSADTYNVYIKLASGQTPSISNTMIVGDDFSGSSLDPQWSIGGLGSATTSVSDGIFSMEVTSNTGGIDYSIYQTRPFDTNEIIEVSERFTNTGTNSEGGLILSAHSSDDISAGSTTFFIRADSSNMWMMETNPEYAQIGNSISNTGYCTWKYVKTGTTWNIYVDDLLISTLPTFTQADLFRLGVLNVGKIELDHVFIRQYTATPPLVSEPTIIDANTLKYTITTIGALTDYQVAFDISNLNIESTNESILVYKNMIFDDPTIIQNYKEIRC